MAARLSPEPRSLAAPTRLKTSIYPLPLDTLEAFLRRIPLTVRQLRSRHADRPPFSIDDEHDLEDLLRSLLPLCGCEVRVESRTPLYSAVTRRDLLVVAPAAHVIAVVGKRANRFTRPAKIEEELRQDVEYYDALGGCRAVVCFILDTAGDLPRPRELERRWCGQSERLRCIIAS
jgi:hypothetical protein